MGFIGHKIFYKVVHRERVVKQEDSGASTAILEEGVEQTKAGWLTHEALITIYLSFIVFLIGCAATLGIDDLLVSFFAGTAFAWTSWYHGQTQEFKFISSLDYLMNCFYFVYLGSIMPFNQFNNALSVSYVPELNIWRLILVGLVVLAVRRVPIVCLLYKLMPDVRNFKEALFVGHFGAVGVGAIYSCIMAIQFLEDERRKLPQGDDKEYSHYCRLIYMMWPIITYIVFISICVHEGSISFYSVAKMLYKRTLK